MMSLPPEQGIEPDRWVVLEIDTGEETVKRILSGWLGGYLDGDSWRYSSRIVEESSNNTHYTFTTNSGSVYHCRCSAEGLTSSTSSVYNNIIREYDDHKIKVKMLCYGDQT